MTKTPKNAVRRLIDALLLIQQVVHEDNQKYWLTGWPTPKSDAEEGKPAGSDQSRAR